MDLKSRSWPARARLAPPGATSSSAVAAIGWATRLARMTDAIGLRRQLSRSATDWSYGYSLDDNARALILMARADDLPHDMRTGLATMCGSLVKAAWDEDAARFHSLMTHDGRWQDGDTPEDSNGRAIWALAVTARSGPSPALKSWALELYERASAALGPLDSPCARAFQMLGAAELLTVRPHDAAAQAVLREGAALLMALLDRAARPDWAWFEIVLAHDNSRLAEALIRAGLALDERRLVATGLDTLEWGAAQVATSDSGALSIWAAVDAYAAAWTASGNRVWLQRTKAAQDRLPALPNTADDVEAIIAAEAARRADAVTAPPVPGRAQALAQAA